METGECAYGPEDDLSTVPDTEAVYNYVCPPFCSDKKIKKKVTFSADIPEDDASSVTDSEDEIEEAVRSCEDIPEGDLPMVSGSEPVFDHVCEPCSDDVTREAVGFCVDCADWLCDECFKIHTRPRPMKHHVLLDLKEMATSTPPPTADKCTENCDKHNGKRLKYYCTVHDFLGCSVCVIRSHKLCKVEHIPDICEYTYIQDEYRQVTAQLDAVSKESEDTYKEVTKNDAIVKSMKEKSVKTLRSYIEKLKETLDEAGDELEETCEKKANKETEKIKNIAENCAATWKESLKMKTRLEHLQNTGQHCNVFVALKRFKDKLATFERQQKDDRLSSSVNTYQFQPNMSLGAAIADTKGIGTLVEQCSIKDKDYSKVQTRHIADISVKTKDNITCGITGSTLLPPNKLILVDFDNKQVKVIDTRTNEMISDYGVDGTPWSVCKASEHFIVVTVCNNHKLLFLYVDVSGNVSTIKALPLDIECKGVAMMDDRIVVTYINPPKIEIMDTYGSVLQTITDPQIVHSPQHVVVSPNSKYMYVSNWENNTMTCVDREGKLIATYTQRSLRAPEQATIDSNGMIYVGGYHSKNVHLVTPDCKKVKVILDESDGLKEVYAVSYCEQTERLYVGMDECDFIKVFQLIFEYS